MKRFQNRKTAGCELAKKLADYKTYPGIVLGIPRGGIPVAHEISHVLQWPLGLVWVKKIGHPFSPEMAIGAATETEVLLGSEETLSDPYIQSAVKGIRDRFSEMKKLIHDPTEKMDFMNKHLVIVDDGIATGHTLLAAIQHLRKKKPAKIIVAIPVAPHDAVVKLEEAADHVIVLYQPDYFSGISAFYEEFNQLTTEEVAGFFKNHLHQWLD
jgi:predicted phosphoribosyltransferase